MSPAKRWLPILACGLAACAASPEPPTEPTPARQQRWGWDLELRYREEGASFLSGESGEERLQVQLLSGVTGAHAEAIVTEKVEVFGSLFRSFRTGYPGQVTQHIDCPDRYAPRYTERTLPGGWLRSFTGYANATYVAGACSEDTIRHRHLHGHLFCEPGTLAEIDLFTPLEGDGIERFLERLDCGA
jgi:hypothetical protein